MPQSSISAPRFGSLSTHAGGAWKETQSLVGVPVHVPLVASWDKWLQALDQSENIFGVFFLNNLKATKRREGQHNLSICKSDFSCERILLMLFSCKGLILFPTKPKRVFLRCPSLSSLLVIFRVEIDAIKRILLETMGFVSCCRQRSSTP